SDGDLRLFQIHCLVSSTSTDITPPRQIEQKFKNKYTARYFADIEFQTGAISQEAVQCLTGVTGFSPEPKCTEKPILSFSWRLLRDDKAVLSGRYGQNSGGSMSASTVGAGFAYFDANRGDKYTLVVDVDSDASRLDITRPTLYVEANSVNLEFAMLLEGLSRVSAVVLGFIGLVCLLLGIGQQRL